MRVLYDARCRLAVPTVQFMIDDEEIEELEACVGCVGELSSVAIEFGDR